MLRHDHANVTSTTRKQMQLDKELEQLTAAMAREAARCSTSRANLSWAMEASSCYQFGDESVRVKRATALYQSTEDIFILTKARYMISF
jgi:hypothetical protein